MTRIREIFDSNCTRRYFVRLQATLPLDRPRRWGPLPKQTLRRCQPDTHGDENASDNFFFWGKLASDTFRSPLRWRGVKLDGSSTTRHSSAYRHFLRSPYAWRRHPIGHAWKLCERDGWSDREIDRAHSGWRWPGRRPLARFPWF